MYAGDGKSQASGNTPANAAARSASFHQPMNPGKDRNVLVNYLARMLPLDSYQHAVYRLGEKHPPGFEDGYCPSWEVATALLLARQTTQLRINFQREFHLFGITATSTLAGGFRMQMFDTKKRYNTWQDVGRRICGDLAEKPGVRLAGRGVLGVFNAALVAARSAASLFSARAVLLWRAEFASAGDHPESRHQRSQQRMPGCAFRHGAPLQLARLRRR